MLLQCMRGGFKILLINYRPNSDWGGFKILLINYRPNSDWYPSIRWLKILHIWRSEISSSRRLQEICYTKALLWSFSWSIWTNPYLSTGCCPEANASKILYSISRQYANCSFDCIVYLITTHKTFCLQVQSKQPQNSCDGFRIKGTYQGLLLIIRCQGWRQLFAGLSLNYVKVISQAQIFFSKAKIWKMRITNCKFCKVNSKITWSVYASTRV
jgi:hypothetical protein